MTHQQHIYSRLHQGFVYSYAKVLLCLVCLLVCVKQLFVFQLEEDTTNFARFKVVGGRLLLKRGVVPHKFECQGHHQAPNAYNENL